jgi:hypothetical protein
LRPAGIGDGHGPRLRLDRREGGLDNAWKFAGYSQARALMPPGRSGRKEEGNKTEQEAHRWCRVHRSPVRKSGWLQGDAARIARPSFFSGGTIRISRMLRAARGFWTFGCDFTISPATPKNTD